MTGPDYAYLTFFNTHPTTPLSSFHHYHTHTGRPWQPHPHGARPQLGLPQPPPLARRRRRRPEARPLQAAAAGRPPPAAALAALPGRAGVRPGPRPHGPRAQAPRSPGHHRGQRLQRVRVWHGAAGVPVDARGADCVLVVLCCAWILPLAQYTHTLSCTNTNRWCTTPCWRPSSRASSTGSPTRRGPRWRLRRGSARRG